MKAASHREGLAECNAKLLQEKKAIAEKLSAQGLSKKTITAITGIALHEID